MIDGQRDSRDELVRHLLKLLQSVVSEGRNPVLTYIVEMALAELDRHGLDERPRDGEKIISRQ